ncbi:unnamed protein product, partial [Amoebophrya sp. A120]
LRALRREDHVRPDYVKDLVLCTIVKLRETQLSTSCHRTGATKAIAEVLKRFPRRLV